jgi:protein involved in polysaccharide export with SLBB domain
MTRKRSFIAALSRAALAAALVFLGAGSVAAQTTPADALQIFQNLTPEQQQALLERAGSPGSASASGGNSIDRASQAADRDARRPMPQQAEPRIPVLGAEDTVVVQLVFPRESGAERAAGGAEPGAIKPEVSAEQAATSLRRQRMTTALTTEQRRDLEDLIALVQSRNPYTLDRSGRLSLPGFAPISLGGLTEEQATQMLSFEPSLLPLEVHLLRLPLAKTGVAGLKPFGYDLFENAPSTFSPLTDVPVPADYVMGAGDELNVQLFGNQNRTLRLTVNRDGSVTFPELGPIRISGLTFNAARQTIESRVEQQMIGVRANVSMGDTRSIRVFVLGEARQQGSYTVSGLATITTALFASGGVKPIGSLRDIQLKRQGVVVRRFDLYDMLIGGDTSDDAKLLPGDSIFIPPVGPTISVDGEVRRPAIYELRGESTIGDIVQMAGGLTPDADASRGSLTRVDETRRRIVLGVNLTQPASRGQSARNGDALVIARLRPQIDAGVMIGGFVHRPGPVAWREGMRLSEIFSSVDELKPNADLHYILIRRETGPDRRVAVLSADLVAALAAPGSAADVVLNPRDQITVFDLAPGRERVIKPILEELRLQGELSRPTELVRVGGSVKVPGEYPLEPGMRVSDLIRAGGNLQAAAYASKAELARDVITAAGSRQTELIDIDLAAVRRGDVAANVLLRPFDNLTVKETSDWTDRESVTLRGEVRFPGTYPIRRSETLRQLLERAGGLTSQAFAKGSAFTRRETREIEQKQLDQLGERLQTSLASLALQAAAANQAGASQALASSQPLLAQLRATKAVGRLTIDMPGLLAAAPGSAKDIELRDGDELVVPKQRNEVTVIGEVQGATSHVYTVGLNRDDYIGLSGGMTRRADRGQIYVVRADGSVIARSGSRFFSRNHHVAIQPGDTIVVPLNTERLPRLPFWQAVTQILYNVAVSVAAINSF